MHERTLLTLVRHGETSANIDGVWHGSTDTPLTEHGLAQARRVAGYVGDTHRDTTAIYASPLQRARITAEAIGAALALEVRLEPGLQEYDLGDWEGMTFEALQQEKQLFTHMQTTPDYAPHGGESPRSAAQRFTAALASIAERHSGERVVVVAHGGVLSLGLAQILSGDYTQFERSMDNCAISELAIGSTAELISFNFTEHLAGV
jgi:broad specificity phosphatase PhoE